MKIDFIKSQKVLRKSVLQVCYRTHMYMNRNSYSLTNKTNNSVTMMYMLLNMNGIVISTTF